MLYFPNSIKLVVEGLQYLKGDRAKALTLIKVFILKSKNYKIKSDIKSRQI